MMHWLRDVTYNSASINEFSTSRHLLPDQFLPRRSRSCADATKICEFDQYNCWWLSTWHDCADDYNEHKPNEPHKLSLPSWCSFCSALAVTSVKTDGKLEFCTNTLQRTAAKLHSSDRTENTAWTCSFQPRGNAEFLHTHVIFVVSTASHCTTSTTYRIDFSQREEFVCQTVSKHEFRTAWTELRQLFVHWMSISILVASLNLIPVEKVNHQLPGHDVENSHLDCEISLVLILVDLLFTFGEDWCWTVGYDVNVNKSICSHYWFLVSHVTE